VNVQNVPLGYLFKLHNPCTLIEHTHTKLPNPTLIEHTKTYRACKSVKKACSNDGFVCMQTLICYIGAEFEGELHF